MTRAELAAEQEPEDGGETAEVAATRPPRTSLVKFPDVVADLRAVPGMFRTRRLLWLPFLLAAGGFVLVLVGNALPASIQPYAGFYVQYFFLPSALFTYFIGGFLAPRGSYLMGGMLGFMIGILWVIVLLVLPDMQQQIGPAADLGTTMGVTLLQSVVLGLVAGGFAGWYRDFLRGMQTRSAERRQQQELAARQKRAADRQEARRSAKQRPAN